MRAGLPHASLPTPARQCQESGHRGRRPKRPSRGTEAPPGRRALRPRPLSSHKQYPHRSCRPAWPITLLEFRRRRVLHVPTKLHSPTTLAPLPYSATPCAGVLRSARRARRRNSVVMRWPSRTLVSHAPFPPRHGGPHGPPPAKAAARPPRHRGHLSFPVTMRPVPATTNRALGPVPATPGSPARMSTAFVTQCIILCSRIRLRLAITLLEFRRRRAHTSRRVRTLRRRLAPPTYSARLAPVFSGAAAGCVGGTRLLCDDGAPGRWPVRSQPYPCGTTVSHKIPSGSR